MQGHVLGRRPAFLGRLATEEEERRPQLGGVLFFRSAAHPLHAGVVGDVFAIFLFKFKIQIDNTDDKLWVIVGDLPSAYLAVDEDDNPRVAAEKYCELMEGWCSAVEGNSEMSDVYPVDAKATLENVRILRLRIRFIVTALLSKIPEGMPNIQLH